MLLRTIRVRLGWGIFWVPCGPAQPYPLRRCTFIPNWYACTWAASRRCANLHRLPFSPFRLTQNPQIHTDVPALRADRCSTRLPVWLTCISPRLPSERLMCVSTVCGTVTPPAGKRCPPPTFHPESNMNLFCIGVNDLPIPHCYLPLESFYGNIITCLICRVCYYPGFSLPICHSDPDVTFVWGAQVRMWMLYWYCRPCI